MVSDTAELGAAPSLPEEVLAHLGENLQRDLVRAIPVAMIEMIPAGHIGPQRMGIGPSSQNWEGNAGSTIWLS